MVEVGADPRMLRRQCIITPQCGLSAHSPSVAHRVHRITAEISQRVRDQANAAGFVLGA
jgi:hypothetical protein